MNTLEFPASIQQDLEKMQLAVSDQQQALWRSYITLLARWNKNFNLTAITDPLQMVYRHLYDSLSIAAYIQGDKVVDVGAGAGLPGIPLAILMPKKEFTLLDSNGKKTRFMQQAVLELGLTNCRVVKSRVEQFNPEDHYDHVVCRAFAELDKITKLCQHLLLPTGSILAMKSSKAEYEVSQLTQKQTRNIKITPLKVIGISEPRCLVEINNENKA